MVRRYKIKEKGRVLLLNGVSISLGNRKISREVGIFNLPRGITCPGQTSMCREKCYARKAERRPIVLKARLRNLEGSREQGFPLSMISLIERAGVSYFRIHESGDFYSQNYLEKWKEIASCLPEVKFLVFTKSQHLNFTRVPNNLVVIYSMWPDSFDLLALQRCAFAGGVGSRFHCPGDCGPGYCTYCWEGVGDIVFDLH